MDALKRAFWKVDRALGGAEPPPRAQVFIAQHPLGAAVVAGIVSALMFGLALSAFSSLRRLIETALWGLGWGLLIWLGCRFERKRQAHYARTGYEPPPQVPVAEEPPPLALEGAHWIGAWVVITVLFWLVGRLKDPPNSWLASAVLAGLFIVLNWVAQTVKRRKRK